MSWDEEELNKYDVRENQDLHQHEKETTMQIDKEDEVVNVHSSISSHVRKILNSPNDEVEVTYIQVDDEGDIWQVGAEIPVDSFTASIKKKPKKQGYISQMLLS